MAITQPPWVCGETAAVPGHLLYLLLIRVAQKAVAVSQQYQAKGSHGTSQLCTASLLQFVAA